MPMAFRIYLALILFLSSCAQVSSLTGGERDVKAPVPIEHKVKPENKSVNFIGNTITLPFSEYVKLNNPLETIVMIPPHAKPIVTLKKKTVTLNWKDTLQDNTTYSIYLNGTVQDITEANDSLMTFVFSTGPMLDSLAYSVKIYDAFTNKPITNCFVGLYSDKTDSIVPTYFVKTNVSGIATFSYLKEGNYTVLAFDDKNKDMFLQPNEKVAFSYEKVELTLEKVDTNSIYFDSIPLRLFERAPKAKLRTITYTAPSLIKIGATFPISGKKYFLNGVNITEKVNFYSTDSLSFIQSIGDSSIIEFVVQSPDYNDTISLRISKNEKAKPVTFWTNLADDVLPLFDTLSYSFSDEITQVDTSKIKLLNFKDSSKINYQFSISKNQLSLIFNRDSLVKARITMDVNAVIFLETTLDKTIEKEFKIQQAKEIGLLKIDLSDYQEAIVLELLLGGKVIKSLPLEEQKELILNALNPGEYMFRIILDENKNGKWDTGNYEKKIAPEIIHTFSESTKVRANWDVDMKLFRNF